LQRDACGGDQPSIQFGAGDIPRGIAGRALDRRPICVSTCLAMPICVAPPLWPSSRLRLRKLPGGIARKAGRNATERASHLKESPRLFVLVGVLAREFQSFDACCACRLDHTPGPLAGFLLQMSGQILRVRDDPDTGVSRG